MQMLWHRPAKPRTDSGLTQVILSCFKTFIGRQPDQQRSCLEETTNTHFSPPALKDDVRAGMEAEERMPSRLEPLLDSERNA